MSQAYKAKSAQAAGSAAEACEAFLEAEASLEEERYAEAEAAGRKAAAGFRASGEGGTGAADAVRVVVKSLLGQERRAEALALASKELAGEGDPVGRAKLQVSAAEASLGAGAAKEIWDGLKEARKTFREFGTKDMEARALLALSALEMERGDADLAELEQGLQHAQEARQRAKELQKRRLEASCLLAAVDGKGVLVSPQDALDVADELLNLSLDLKDRRLEARALMKLAAWNLKLGDRYRAISDAEEAWELCCDLDSPQAPRALQALVEGLLPVKPARARRIAAEALRGAREKGQKRAEIQIAQTLLEVTLHMGDITDATSITRDCIRVCKELEATTAQAGLMLRLAQAQLQAGGVETAQKAVAVAEDAWEMLHGSKDGALAEKVSAMEVLCDATVQLGEPEAALNRALEFRDYFARKGDVRGQAKAALRCAQLQSEVEDYEAAHASAQKAYDMYRKDGQKKEAADAMQLCSKILWKKSDYKAAVTWAERARPAYRDLDRTEDEIACLYIVAENAARLAQQEGAKVAAVEPPPRVARDALEKSLKAAEVGLKLLRVTAAVQWPELHGQLLCARAQALTFKSLYKEALDGLDEAVLRFRELNEYNLEANALLLACDNMALLNRRQEAAEAAEEALMLYKHCADFEGEARAQEMLKQMIIAPRQAAAASPDLAAGVPGVTPVWLQQAEDSQAPEAGEKKPTTQVVVGPSLDVNAISGEMIMGTVRDIVSNVTATEKNEIDMETPLMEAGLTSTSAVLLRDVLAKTLPGVQLPVTLVFDYPTIAEMTDMIQASTQAIKN